MKILEWVVHVFGKKPGNDWLGGTKGQIQLSDSPLGDFFLFCRLSLCLSVLHLSSNSGFLLVRERVKGHFGVGWRRERESKFVYNLFIGV